MGVDIELVAFLDAIYLPDHKSFPGLLSIGCVIREWGGLREQKCGYSFQYERDTGRVYFLVYPSYVRLLIGKAGDPQEAIEQAKQWLTRWLGEDTKFRMRTAGEIERLEEEQRAARRSKKAPPPSQGG